MAFSPVTPSRGRPSSGSSADRPPSRRSVGYVGVPHGVELPIAAMFARNKGVRGGSAPARAYIP
ncbi:MAG TPA: hypothetical protein VGF29_03900, partial [Hyphomicrobiaceae bacterium]